MVDESLYSEWFLERFHQLFEGEFKKENLTVDIFACHYLNQINDRVFLQTDQHILLHYPFNMNLHLPSEKSPPSSRKKIQHPRSYPCQQSRVKKIGRQKTSMLLMPPPVLTRKPPHKYRETPDGRRQGKSGWIGSGEEDDGDEDRVYECQEDYGPSQGTGGSEYVLRGYLSIIAATVNNAYTYLKYDTEYEHNEYTVQKIQLCAEVRF
jgi:hypothetical protein